jgi:hypothetical protein
MADGVTAKNQRRTAFNLIPYSVGPIPDGSINTREDRIQSAYHYTLTLAVANAFSINVSAVLSAAQQYYRSFETNAVLLKLYSITKSIELDAILHKLRSRTLSVDARLKKVTFGDRSIKIFPIGYVDSDKSTSKGSFTDPDIAIIDRRSNELLEPNKSENKTISGHTLRSADGPIPLETRKVSDHRHMFTYGYNNIYNGEYRLIKRFVADIADYQSNSFYLVDFSGAVKVTALATTAVATYNASLHDTHCFTTASGRGGNYICVRNGRTRQLRIGKVTEIAKDQSVSFQATPGYGDLATLTSGETYSYPLYRVFIAQEGLNFKVDGFVDKAQNASLAGPVRSGNVSFRQRGTK